MKNKVDISIVIPAYNEEESLEVCVEEVTKECEKLNKSYEIVFVNDGSKDKTYDILESITKSNKNVKAVHFSRNFGQSAALIAGFKYASGDAVINIDCDLQDPPSLISDFVAKWEEGYDIVLAKRRKRSGETIFKKLTAKIYYGLFKWLAKSKTPVGCGISRLISRQALDVILSMPEHDMYLAGMTEYVGFKQTIVEFDRESRKLGKTKYTLKKMVTLALNGIIPFSSTPIAIVFGLGIFFDFLGVASLLTFAVLSIVGVCFSSMWWILSAITLSTGIIVTAIGIIGAYVALSYTEVLNRPKYIVSKTMNCEDAND